MPVDQEQKWTKVTYDLRNFVKSACEKFSLEAIYLFGSRRFGTLSLRSDIDIFLVPTIYIKLSDLREFIADKDQFRRRPWIDFL